MSDETISLKFKTEFRQLMNKFNATSDKETAYYAGDPSEWSVRVAGGLEDISIGDLLEEFKK